VDLVHQAVLERPTALVAQPVAALLEYLVALWKAHPSQDLLVVPKLHVVHASI
jgi:hypothetical protein